MKLPLNKFAMIAEELEDSRQQSAKRIHSCIHPDRTDGGINSLFRRQDPRIASWQRI